MKYAIATDNGVVSAHFGRCPSYTIFNREGDKIFDIIEVPNPGHSTGSIPAYLNEKKVNAIISGGIGQKALSLFKEYGMNVIVGITGSIKEVIEKIKSGRLTNSESLCSPQGGHGYGIPKKDGHGK